ncbi:MAG: hypothetical protein COA83_11695 [Methylophaga sp.]|nr:MAG: hypothetical protein COA83_11695 [Methylophaga sp.]
MSKEQSVTEKNFIQRDKAKLPNLAPRVIAVVIMVSLIMLLVQYAQDHFRQEEIVDTQRISLYHQQAEIAGRLMNASLLFKENNNEIAIERSHTALRMAMNELRMTQQRQLNLAQQLRDMNEDDNIVEEETSGAKDIDQLIVYTNTILAAMEGQAVGIQPDDIIYSQLQGVYQHYKNANERLINKLSKHLQYESEIHRDIAWWLTAFTILLTFLVSLGIYWRGKRLVHQQFSLITDVNKQLSDENKLRKRAETDAIAQSELALMKQMKLNSILESTVDAIITITADGTIDSFNEAAEKMFGYSADYAISKNVKFLMPEPYSLEHDAYLINYQKTGKQKIIGQGREVIAKRVDGSEFPVFLSVGKVEGVKPPLFTGIVQDISARKKIDEKLQKTLEELTQKQSKLEEEERIAKHVFENITASNNDIIAGVSSWCEPMGAFSGDMVLSAILPSGSIRIILCDFTGHGLPAALGAVPVSTIHSAMAKKGLPLQILMNELNNKLNELLPTGIFCCIAGIDVDASRTHAQIWNAGLPEVLVVNKSGEITQRIVSNHLPLGVVAYNKNELHCREIQLGAGDLIYALSDGLTEAKNEAGDMFGQQRFEQLLMSETDEHGRLTEIRNSIGKFVGKAAATDDVSLIEIKTLVTTD